MINAAMVQYKKDEVVGGQGPRVAGDGRAVRQPRYDTGRKLGI